MAQNKGMRHGYHDLCRPEILELVPTNARTVLDLGCGTGSLGKAIKKRQDCICKGIELNKEASEIAAKNLDFVWCDNLNRFDPKFLKTKYDCMVFADILEHLVNPWVILNKFAKALADNGAIIVSLPNIAHPEIISELKKGLFRYRPAGILDITHLRFFTKTTIFQMFYSAGLKITEFRPSPSPNNPIQYLIKAVKIPVPSDKPIVTILLLSWNAWGFTKQCIESIKKNTTVPYKLLVVDNGSHNNVVKELREDLQLYHIENSCNLGFAKGFNVGLELVDTPYFVISNTDVVVTKNWLKTMIDHIDSDDDLVCLGPMSNNVSGPQKENDVSYTNETELAQHAIAQEEKWHGKLIRAKRVVFFCTLFKRKVLSVCGLLDERYELGNFEDDDYCMKINTSGMKTAIDESVFIHHYQGQTFKENLVDFKKTLEENEAKFLSKWKFPSLQDYYTFLDKG